MHNKTPSALFFETQHIVIWC